MSNYNSHQLVTQMVLMSSTQNTICNLLYMWRHLIGPLYYQIGSFLLVSRYILYRYIKTVLLLANVVKLFCGSFGPFALYPLLPHCLLTLRCQINESGGKSASRVGLVNTFFCLFVCFFDRDPERSQKLLFLFFIFLLQSFFLSGVFLYFWISYLLYEFLYDAIIMMQ